MSIIKRLTEGIKMNIKKLMIVTACCLTFSAHATTYVVKPLKPVIEKLCTAKASQDKVQYKRTAKKYGVTKKDLEWLEEQPVCKGLKLGSVGKT